MRTVASGTDTDIGYLQLDALLVEVKLAGSSKMAVIQCIDDEGIQTFNKKQAQSLSSTYQI
jgi:hypothetical protein